MAEFIIGNALREPARRYPLLRRLLWAVDHALVRPLVALFRLLPVDTASALGERVGRVVGPRLKHKTALYRANLAAALPQLDAPALDALVVEAWGRAGRVLGEYPHLDTLLRDEDRLQLVIAAELHGRLEPGRPRVAVTAHQANWELICTALARLGIDNAGLYSPPANPHLDRLLLAHRRALKCELLPRDNAARLLVRALGEGRTAAMVADRRIDEGERVSFFGRDKFATLLPARLALKFDCDLVPVQVERLHGARYRVSLHPPLQPRNPAADEAAQALDLTQQLHAAFEDWIRAAPRDWFACQRIWPAETGKEEPRPAGAQRDAA